MFPTHDPRRKEVAGFVASLRTERKARAAYLRAFRRELAALEKAIHIRNRWARLAVGNDVLPRADVRSLRALAVARMDYAESRAGFGGHDSEYYSACGHDDHVAEAQDYARSVALEIWRTLGRF